MYAAKIPVIHGIFQWHNQCGVRAVHDGKDALVYERKFKSEYLERQIYKRSLKDVRAHCYCASLLRTLFIGHARATSFSSARTDSKTEQNIERITFALR